jgi:hypothetical protein
VKAETGIESELTVGSRGQFDVLLDGAVIASRASGFVTRLLGGGWPEPKQVVDAVRARQRAPA